MYHRAYRRLRITSREFSVDAFVLALPFFLVLVLHPSLTHTAARFLTIFFPSVFPGEPVELIEIPFLWSKIWAVNTPGKFPSPTLAWGTFVFSLAVLVVSSKFFAFSPFSLLLAYIAVVNAVSGLFFAAVPYRFPYDMTSLCRLYMKLQAAVWLVVPLLISCVLLPLPSSLLSRTLFLLAVTGYFIVFGLVRFLWFVLALKRLSYLFAPMLLFVFGPFMDFLYTVSFYGFYVSLVARRCREEAGVWKWVF